MTLVSSGSEELPLLETCPSPDSPPVAVHCWRLRTPSPPPPLHLSDSSGCLAGVTILPQQQQQQQQQQLQQLQQQLQPSVTVTAVPSHHSWSGADSGCESDGVVDSAYSTVTSCTSDTIRMQLDSELAEQPPQLDSELAEQPPQQPAGATEPPQPPPQLAVVPPTEQQPQTAEPIEARVRSWSLEARTVRPPEDSSPCSVGPVGADAHLLEPTVMLRHSQSEPSLAASASTASMPICRICHMPGDERCELITPCRCAGTMQYIHAGCLMHWLEVSSRRTKCAPRCELCQYQYQRHKRFRVGRWLVPAVSCRDKLLHGLFLLSLVVMVVCSIITIYCFKQDSGKRYMLYDEAELTSNETLTLVCGILFFASFFIGMYSEIKARYSMYHLIMRTFYLNQQWLIDQYDPSKDEKFRGAPPHKVAFAV